MKKLLNFSETIKKYPVLLAFTTKGVQATNDYDISQMTDWMKALYDEAEKVRESFLSQESTDFLTPFISETVLPEKRTIELERTMFSLMTLEAIVSGDYSFFAETTKPLFGEPLSKEQFGKIVEIFKTNNIDKKMVELSLVLGDIGKIKPLRDALCEQFNIDKQDPDEFLGELLNQDFEQLQKTLALFANISKEEFECLKKSHIDLHFGHLVHAECNNTRLYWLGENFLKESEENWKAFYTAFIVQLCDVAGAAAQAGGKTILNQVVALTYLDGVLPSIELIKTGKSGADAYKNYLKFRLNHAGMNFSSSKLGVKNVWLARFMCMMRVYDNKSAEKLDSAIENLLEEDGFKKDLETFKTYESDGATPTYIPALLGQLLKAKDYEDALRLTMRVVASACAEQMKGSWDNPANFNGLTGLARDDLDEFLLLAKSGKVFVAEDGMVSKPRMVEEVKDLSFMASDQRAREKSTEHVENAESVVLE